MSFRFALAPVAAMGLIAAPLVAEAVERMPSPVGEAEQLTDETRLPVLLAIAGFLAVVAFIVFDQVDDDLPVSP